MPFSLSYSGIGLKIIVIMKLLLWQRIWKLLGVIILQYIGNTVNSFVFSLLILKKWKLNNMHIYFFYSIFNLSTFLFVKYCLKTVPVLIIYLIILLPAFLAVVNSAVMNSYVGKAWSGFLCVWGEWYMCTSVCVHYFLLNTILKLNYPDDLKCLL